MNDLYVVSTILEWVAIVFLGGLVLTLMRLFGSLDAGVHADHAAAFLKGVNINDVVVEDARTSSQRAIRELIDGAPKILFLMDPACRKCEAVLTKLMKSEGFLPETLILAVRGKAGAAKRFAEGTREDVRVIAEASDLYIGRASPPFAAIVGGNGTYISAVEFEHGEAEASTPVRLLELVEGRERALEAEPELAQVS